MAADTVGKRGGLPRWAGYLVRPVFLGLVCLALYLWGSSLNLDSIEQRELNASTLTQRFIEHLEITGIAVVAVVVLAVSAGVLLTRPFVCPAGGALRGRCGQYRPGRAVRRRARPAGYIARSGVRYGPGGVVAYSFLPVLRNTMVGLRQVDRSVIELARGMGMTKRAVLFRIELPLAVPVMLAGIRTALVITVGTATLVTLVGAGGLGPPILTGITLERTPVLVTGAVLTAVLALFIDWLAGVAEDVLRPKGL